MSITDPPRSFTRAGLRYTIEGKLRDGVKWDENLHPRDREGRFIETGAEVRVWGGIGGRVLRNVGGGRIEIVHADGSHAFVHRNYLTVVQRPDGSAPTAQQGDNVAALPEQAPEKPNAEEFAIPQEPTPGADTVRDQGGALADAVDDPALAKQVRDRTSAYHAAVMNNVPGDEADERAALLETLGTVQQAAAGDADVSQLVSEVRAAATAEPAAPTPDAPAAPTPDAPNAPAAPARSGPSIVDQVRQNRGQTINAVMTNGDTVTGTVVGIGDGSIDIQRTGGGVDRVREADIERINRAIPAAAEGHGTIANPDDPSGPPTYDGPLDQAHTRLAPGTYDATDQNGTPVQVAVTEDSSTVSPRSAPNAAQPSAPGPGRSPDTPPPPGATSAPVPDNAVTLESLLDHRNVGRDRRQWYRIDWNDDRDNPEGNYASNPARGRPIRARAVHGSRTATTEGDLRMVFATDQGNTGELDLPPTTRLIPIDPPENITPVVGETEPDTPAPPPAPDLPETPAGPPSIDDVRASLREFGARMQGNSNRVATTLGRNARGIARTRNDNLRLSPGGGVIARRDPSGGWIPYAVGDANRLSESSVRFTDAEIDDVLKRFDDIGAPFGNHDELIARWRDRDQRRQDAAAMRAIGNDVVDARGGEQTFEVPRGRFRNIEQVRRHLRTSNNTVVQEIASDPMAELSATGRLLVHRNTDGQLGWHVVTTHAGKQLNPRLFGTKAEALDFANTVERNAVDKDGNAYPFDGAMGERRLRTWRNAQHRYMTGVINDALAAVPAQNPNPADFTDAWYSQRARETVNLPDDLTSLPAAELSRLSDEAYRLRDTAARHRISAESERRAAADREAALTRELRPEELSMLTQGQANGDYALVERNLRDMFTFTHTNGWTTKWHTVSNTGSTYSKVGGKIVDDRGREVGTVTRSVTVHPNGEVEVHHDFLAIDTQYQGQGFADAYYKHLYAEYEKRGVDFVTIQANIDVGGYAWAQRGFGWDERLGEPSSYFMSRALNNIDEINTSGMSEEDKQRIAQFRQDVSDRKFTPKEMANALSDIRWTKTSRSGSQIQMWPGKAAMLGTNWHGKFYVKDRQQQKPEQPARPPVEIADTNVTEMAEDALSAEAARNSDLIAQLMNVERRPGPDPDVVRLVARQQAIGAERNRRIEVARTELIPDGEDVSYTDLRAGDTVVVPFITDRAPEIATIVSVDGNEVRVRYDDGTERPYMMIGGLTSARWRRATPAETPVPPSRFTNIDEVRQNLLDGSHSLITATIAQDPLAAVSDGGRFLVHRSPAEGERHWRISTTGAGTLLWRRQFGTRDEALEYANRFERESMNADGQPFPGDQLDARNQIPGWRTADGRTLRDLITALDADIAQQPVNDADFTDEWWQNNQPDPIAVPDDLTGASDDDLDEWASILADGGDDPETVAQLNAIYAEMERRQNLEEQRRLEEQRLEEEAATRELTPEERRVLSTRDGAQYLVERNLRDMFSFTHTNGWKTSFSVYVEGDASRVNGRILDENGRSVGQITRSLYYNSDGELEVHHDYLTLDGQYQGQGFADAYYKHLYEQYEQRGIDVVTIQANIDVGGYAWAQRGFGWDPNQRQYDFQDDALENLDRIDTSGWSPENVRRLAEFRDALAEDPEQFTPKQIANALSDIRWTKTIGTGAQVQMWPGKAAMLGTNWYGSFRVAERQSGPPAVDVPSTNTVEMGDADLAAEAVSNAETMQRLMNVERRPDTDPDVVRLVARQQAISTERNRRIEVARNALIPDGEDVGYADLRAGDTVVVPFITDRGPEIATITSVDGNHVRVRYDDGTERSYMMVGNLTSARWRRGKVGGTEVVTTRDLNVGDRLMLDDGHTARIDVIGDGFNGRILLEVTDDTGQAREIEADRYGSHIRVTTEEVDPAANRPDVADMSDDDLFAEAVENTRAGADTSPGHPLSARQQAIYAEQMRRVKVALLTRPVQVAQVTDATARPRLYTYQRKNLVALGLDTPEAGAPPEVQQAAARVRARQPLTAAQSAALADYVRAIAGNPDTRVQRQRSLNRLAAAFDTSAAVAAGRRADAPQPGNDRVQRVKGTGLTAGDTAVIRGADGKLATVRVRETQTMMRGTLARVTIEHDDGTTETRILDRDADVWLMPDLPPDKPAPVEELPGIELVYAEDLRVGDTMSYMRGGQYLEGQIASISVHSSDGSITFTMADDRQTPISMPSEMRSRIARGPESADQPYLYSVKLSAQPETISGLDVQPGDRVEMNIFDPPARGTVLSIEEATGEDGTTGRYVTFADDTGAIMTAMLFESMHVTRFAKGADNAAETIRQMMDARRAREAENSVVQSLDHIQSRSMARLASSAYDIAAGSGRDAVIRHIEGEIADGGYVAQTEVNNLMANLDVDNRAAVRNLAQQLAADSYQRLLRSVREAEPIGDEAEHQMMQRVLLQHVSHPTLRHNREIARSLLRSIGALSETQNVERITPAVAEGDLPTRMESYRQALGGRFGHVNTRRATYGTVDFNALERGEEPPVTYEDKFVRDTDARDGGPGETAMNHLEIVRAAGADIDANLQQRIADRMTRDGVDLPPEAQGNVSAYMQQLEDLSKELGTARAAAYQRRLYSSTREERAAGLEEWTRIQAEQDELLGRLGRLRQQFATAQRQAATDILSGLRQIGGVRLDYQDADPTRGRGRYRGSGAGHDLGERDQNVRAMRTAEDVLPTDWLNSIRSHVRTAYGRTRIGLGTLRRGHADYRGNIRLSEVGGPFFDGDPGRGQVAVHELSHFAERAVPGMLAAEEAFLWSRTSSGQVGSREREAMVNMDGIGGDSTQFGFTDDFRKPYTGVDYQRSRGRTTQAFEVLTTGVESLFAGSQYMDDDMRAWLLGALALL